MKNYLMLAGALLVASSAAAADQRTGRIVITNDAHKITAVRMVGNIAQTLLSLRTSNAIAKRPYGAVVFQSSAPVNRAVPEYLASYFAEAGQKHGVDPRLVAAVAHRESRYNPKAVSQVGACGLMQLMPATAKWLGVTDVFDARQNAFAGAKYLRTLLDTFNGDLDLTLAAYNAGPGAVRKFNGIPPYKETRAYVAAVRATYEASLR